MTIFILSVTAGVLFEGAFSLRVSFQTGLVAENGCLIFLSGFSFEGTGDLWNNRRREETNLFRLYDFHPLTTIHTFTYNFACGINVITYKYQVATR